MSMTFESNQTVIGLDLKQARDLMLDIQRQCASGHNAINRYFNDSIAKKSIRKIVFIEDKHKSDYHLSWTLNDKAKEMTPIILQRMVAEGFIKSRDQEYFNYKITSKGMTLARHKFLKPLSRTASEERISELLNFVIDSNAMNNRATIKNIWMFGDITSESESISKIEFICEFEGNQEIIFDGNPYDWIYTILCKDVESMMGKISRHFHFHPLRPFSLKYVEDGYIQIVKDRMPVPHIKLALSKAKPKSIKKNKEVPLKWFFMGMRRDPAPLYFNLNIDFARSLLVHMYREFNLFGNISIREEELDDIIKRFVTYVCKDSGNCKANPLFELPVAELSESIKSKICQDGYLEKEEHGCYEFTRKVDEIFIFKRVSPLPLAKANAILEKFLNKIESFNMSKPPYTVKNAWVYGEIAAGSPEVGDVELICEYEAHPDSADYPEESELFYMQEKGKSPLVKTEKFLKKGLPRIAFMPFIDECIDLVNEQGHYIQIVQDHKVIYSVPA